MSLHQEGHHRCTDRRTVIDTLYVDNHRAQVVLHLASLGGHVKKDSLQIVCPFRRSEIQPYAP